MPLAVFDIDGTLIDSTAIDTRCFLDAFLVEFGLDASAVDPATVVHYTDRGIVADLLRGLRSREAEEIEISRHRARYIAHLREHVAGLTEIAGARAFVGELRRHGWSIAIATGAWRESALLKLTAAGFAADVPLACCDDLVSREEIVREAIALAGSPDPPIVLFGDGVWDVQCARKLRLPIVAVGRGADAERLRRAGARAVVGDFADAQHVFSAIARVISDQ